MALLQADMQDFLKDEQAHPKGEFVRIEFFEHDDFDPTTDAELAQLGDWRWNDEHDHLMLIAPDADKVDTHALIDKLMWRLVDDGLAVTDFEIRHIKDEDVKPAMMA